MDIIAIVSQMLLQDEGEKSHIYRDSLNIWTIGIGRNVDEHGPGLRKSEMLFMLKNDVEECISDLEQFPFWSTLSDPRKVALINFRFQMGPAGFRKFEKTIDLLNNHNYSQAASEMLNSSWATQTPERAHKIAHIVNTGVLT